MDMPDQMPMPGEMWWLDCGEQWVPVVVLDNKVEDDRFALDVVPAGIEVDDLDCLDLLLLPAETSSGRPWRLIFRCQSIIDRRKLRERFGALTPAGWSRVHEAVWGDGIAPERRGPRLESDYDPRLETYHELTALLLPCLREC
jgi:hypothetical protein